MTIAELQDLLVRGAALPGVREAEEAMKLSADLERQARDLAELYVSAPVTSVSNSSAGSIVPIQSHANLG